MMADDRMDPASSGGWTDAAPATSAQQRMWLMDELAPDRAANHIPILYEVSEAFDVPAAQRALNHVIARHDALSARYVLGIDGLEQVRTAKAPELIVERASVDDDQEATDFVAAVVRREFDLERGPMMRASVAAVSGGRRLMVLVFHHLCIDGWSLRRVLDEIWTAYTSLGDRVAQVRETYFDYARRERRWLESQHAKSQLESLAESMREVPRVVRLPSSVERTVIGSDSTEGALHTATVSSSELEPLVRWCTDLRCTRFVMMLAVYTSLVRRISRMSDFLLAIPVANRTLRDMDTVGLFTNIVPVKVSAASAASLPDLVRTSQEAVLDALDWQAVPFDRVARRLSAPGQASRFCNVSFGMGDELDREPVAGLSRLPFEAYAPVRYDLAGYVTSGEDVTTLSLFSDPRVVAEHDACTWLDLWRDLVRNPEDLVSARG
ncbi:condensation domain-containing protein [Streptomyces violaceusniger]